MVNDDPLVYCSCGGVYRVRDLIRHECGEVRVELVPPTYKPTRAEIDVVIEHLEGEMKEERE